MSRQSELQARLQNQLAPQFLQIDNESRGHGGYYEGKESHFKVTIVSDAFAGLRLVARHQKIYALAEGLMGEGGIHALAIHAYAPNEWTGDAPDSPACAHQRG